MSDFVFRRKANRPRILFTGHGFVPVAQYPLDDIPVLLTRAPEKIGDEALIEVEGKTRRAMLLRSEYHIRVRTYLVDMGPA